MSFRDDFRKLQSLLGVPATGIPNDPTKAAFQLACDRALAEYRETAGTATPVPAPAPSATQPWLVVGRDFPLVGQPFTAATIAGYLASFAFEQGFRPTGITVHHCAAPSLAQRPAGFTSQHMLNLRDHYRKSLGWNSGPHFFVDDDQIWAFTPLNLRGVHAVSFNRTHVGIEMLGDYDDEEPWSGRGRAVLTMTRTLIRALAHRLGLSHSAVNFHRDDPKTSKTCPGTRISKDAFRAFLDQP